MNSSIADLIAPQLPYVRRFGRALTGSQSRGDAYVVALLEALVADKSLFDRTLSPRTALYRAFLHVWNAMPMNQQTEQPDGIADRRIETLTPAPRQAFLLASVEEFPTEEIALILGKTADEVRALVDTASREISQQISARVMIIEDEPLIAMDIETLVSEVGHEVVGIAATRKEAVALARQSSPGIILADIQLADGSSGIDAVADILREFNVALPDLISRAPLDVVDGKLVTTGALINFSVDAGALIAIASEAEKTALSRYAHDIGLTFQMVDDLLDAEGVVRDTGKAVGKDKGRGKVNFVTVLGAEATRERIGMLAQQAKQHVAMFGPRASVLRDAVDFVVERRF